MEFFCIADSNKNFFALAGAVVPVVVGVGVVAAAVLFVVVDVFVVVVRVKIRSLFDAPLNHFYRQQNEDNSCNEKMVFIVLTDLSRSSFYAKFLT